VIAAAHDGVTTAPGGPVPLRPPTPANGGPARPWSPGAHSFDPLPADLPAAVLATTTAALAATGAARDAACDIAPDPSFSPD
jgi:hypothetical protein